MTGARSFEARGARYELEIAIDAPRERLWTAIIDDVNAWWLPDFHMVGAGSRVTLDVRAGGGLVEHLDGGGSLLWYTVQWCRPAEFTLYLVGDVAADWGGPATTHLKLEIAEPSSGQSLLKVADAHFGHIDDDNLRSLQEGWLQLFSEGLKPFAERGVRHDGA